MFGYLDESGAPGVASHNKDCLTVSLVLFSSEKSKNQSISEIEKLCKSLRLPDNYEFHCSSNSTKPQLAFLRLLSNLNFIFITIVIHKNDFKKTASFTRMSELIVNIIEKHFPIIKIEMDSNPILYAELHKRIREKNLKNIKVRERNSRSSRLIQVADYVVNISTKKAKNTQKSCELYKFIKDKELIFLEIND
jgi:hypothetical protein